MKSSCNYISYFLFVLIIPQIVFAQYTPGSTSNGILPKLISPSPEASALGKYGEWQVSYYTGLPNISIPIYEVKPAGGDITIPINLSYHGGGVKVDEISSSTGINWSLNAGGVITRTVVGLPDIMEPRGFLYRNQRNLGFKTSYNIYNSPDDFVFLKKVTRQEIDTEPDIFHFNFLGFSGKFYFDKTGAFQCIPANTLKLLQCPVNNTLVAQPEYWQEWIIADDKGNKYYFGSHSAVGVETTTMQGMPFVGIDELNTAITSWYLTKVVLANKEEVIFQYSAKTEIYRQPDNYSFKVLTNVPTNYPNGSATWAGALNCDVVLKNGKPIGNSPESYTDTYISGSTTLQKILWSGGEIVFESNTARLDINSGRMLDGIIIKNSLNKVLKKFGLTYQYTNQRYYLTNLKETDEYTTAATTKLWQFNYLSPINLPPRGSFAQDHWGYYNGRTFNTHLIPPQADFVNPTLSADRKSDENNMKLGSLQSITYPTGGRTEFLWEANKMDLNSPVGGVPPNTPEMCGGLRIKEITNFNVSTVVSKKRFEYSAGQMLVFPKYVHQYGLDVVPYQALPGPGEGSPINCQVNFAKLKEATSSSQAILGFTQGAPVGYLTVKEFSVDLAGQDNGYSQYMYTFTQDIGNELQYDGGYWPGMNILNTAVPLTSNEFKRGLLHKKIDYKRKTDGTYLPVGMVENTYSFSNPDRLNSLKAMRVKTMRTVNYPCGDLHGGFIYPTGYSTGPDFAYSFYELTTGWVQQTSTFETSYDDNGLNPSSKTTSYAYSNSLYLQPTAVETTTSTAKVNRKEFKYPYDYPTNPVYSGMVTRNIVSPTVQVVSKVVNGAQSTVLSTDQTEYKLVNDIYKPDIIKRSQYSNSLENVARFNQYDLRGNITEMQKDTDVKMSYLWNNTGHHPVAEVVNAAVKDIFYNGFEEGDGNSSIDDAKAGRRSKTNGLNTTLTGLTNGSYKLEYWRKTGGTWSLQQSVSTVTSGSLSISLSGQIDELRVYPASAQMTTYTYDLLVGVTSVNDANNRFVFYEYDAFQRLLRVRDHDRRIIKTFCYNYFGQPTSCTVFNSVDKSANYTRNNCASGTMGAPYYVTIPAGMFTSTISQADADAQATAYGQAQANINGTCVSSNITILCNNNVTPGTVYMQYYNENTHQMYNFSATQGSNINLGTIPAGTYSITIGTSNPMSNYYFTVACGFFYYGNNATFYNVTVNSSCRVISISPY